MVLWFFDFVGCLVLFVSIDACLLCLLWVLGSCLLAFVCGFYFGYFGLEIDWLVMFIIVCFVCFDGLACLSCVYLLIRLCLVYWLFLIEVCCFGFRCVVLGVCALMFWLSYDVAFYWFMLHMLFMGRFYSLACWLCFELTDCDLSLLGCVMVVRLCTLTGADLFKISLCWFELWVVFWVLRGWVLVGSGGVAWLFSLVCFWMCGFNLVNFAVTCVFAWFLGLI